MSSSSVSLLPALRRDYAKTKEELAELGHLAQALVDEGLLTSVDQSPILASDVSGGAISEMFLCGGDTHLYPVTSWDEVPVGNRQVGPVVKRLIDLLEEEAFGTRGGRSSDFIKVDYPD